MRHKSFAAFILTHGRPDRVFTYNALIRSGYTGRVIILIDNEDKHAAEYRERFGDMVRVFDKEKVARTFDNGDNSGERRAIVFARNACWEIARQLRLKHYMQLDDDYSCFRFRRDEDGKFGNKAIKTKLDELFDLMIDFVETTKMDAISLAQGGDFIGGEGNRYTKGDWMPRKCMNTWLCTTKKPFPFVGRMNEDVTAYVREGYVGRLFGMLIYAVIEQTATQQGDGGMTSVYKDNGTYIKSFFTILYAPSCTTISIIGHVNPRFHHRIDWGRAAPLVVAEELKVR